MEGADTEHRSAPHRRARDLSLAFLAKYFNFLELNVGSSRKARDSEVELEPSGP